MRVLCPLKELQVPERLQMPMSLLALREPLLPMRSTQASMPSKTQQMKPQTRAAGRRLAKSKPSRLSGLELQYPMMPVARK